MGAHFTYPVERGYVRFVAYVSCNSFGLGGGGLVCRTLSWARGSLNRLYHLPKDITYLLRPGGSTMPLRASAIVIGHQVAFQSPLKSQLSKQPPGKENNMYFGNLLFLVYLRLSTPFYSNFQKNILACAIWLSSWILIS